MGLIVRALTRRNIVAIVAGVLLAGAPLVAFDFWLGGLIDRQGQEEGDTSAKRAIALAESRVTQVIATLDGLAARGVDSCRLSDVEAMRQAAFDTMPVKEIAVIGPDGQTLCTHLGLPLGQRKMVASEPLVGANWYSFDIIQLENGQPMVRLRRQVGAGPNGIAALVPAFLFLPQISSQGGPFSAYAHIATANSIIIVHIGERPDAADAAFVANTKSEKFGFDAEISMPRGHVIAGHAELQWLRLFATGAILMILGVFSMLMPWRAPGNPVAEIERSLQAGEFIPLAESSGLIREMTRDLMRRVCVEAGHALGCRPALKISFNFAGQLFSDEGIVKDVRKIFSGSPIKLSQVVLEVTERDPIENFTATRQTIAAFQGLGVRIAINDVGTGHSGLSYMLKLGVDIIKIDKIFVDAIGTDRNSTTIVQTLVDLAHNMRMDVVAEGVENFEQVMYLRELGVSSAQGYVFAPPLPGKSFLQLVEAIDPRPAAAAEPKTEMADAQASAQVSAA